MSRIDDLLEQYPPFMSAREVAQLLGVTERTVVRWLKDSDMPGIQYPRRGWTIVRDELRDWLNNRHNQRGIAGLDQKKQEDAQE